MTRRPSATEDTADAATDDARAARREAARRRHAREVHVERLLGKKVVDAAGEEVGRLHEVVAEVGPDETIVGEYHVGRHALAERFGGGPLAHSLVRLLTRDKGYEGYVVSWDQMDLSDPERPRCTVRKASLQRA